MVFAFGDSNLGKRSIVSPSVFCVPIYLSNQPANYPINCSQIYHRYYPWMIQNNTGLFLRSKNIQTVCRHNISRFWSVRYINQSPYINTTVYRQKIHLTISSSKITPTIYTKANTTPRSTTRFGSIRIFTKRTCLVISIKRCASIFTKMTRCIRIDKI